MWLSDMFTERKQKLFYELLTQQCALLLRAAQTLGDFCVNSDQALADEIAQIELRGDELLKQIVAALTDTFITPFDRQDIYNLAVAIDDMIDYLNDAASEMLLFHIEATPATREMAQILIAAANDIGAAVNAMPRDSRVAADQASRATHAENSMENLYRRTLAELFEGSDVNRIFKLREIYRHLSNSADQADAIGKLIGKIVVKAT